MKPTGDREERPRLAWDKAKIIAALRARQNDRLEMNYETVRESDRRLCDAMKRYFGSFDEALRAAGIDPATARSRARWDSNAVVAALRDRRDKGLPMNRRAVDRSDSRLIDAIARRFTSFGAALRAAGVELDGPAPSVPWDRARIVAALIDRRLRGLALNFEAVRKSDASLARAITRHFGRHDAALLAAGIDPASARKAPVWDKARVVAALRARRDAGLGLSHRAIYQDDIPLTGGITRCFGSTGAALRAAGIDPESVGAGTQRWDKPALLAALRDRQAKGLKLNAGAVCKSRPGLYRVASRHFGSYDAALRAAGIDPDLIRQQHPGWDRPMVIEAVRARHSKGLALNPNAVQASEPSLHGAMRFHFDSYDEALRAAGVDPAAVRRLVAWDKEKIAAALRDRQARGLEMHSKAIVASDMRLIGAINRHYGSLDEALRAVGIDPASVRLARASPDKEAIFAALREIAPDGRISPAMVRAADRRMLDIMRHRFGTVEAAVAAAGLTYFRGRPGTSHGTGHWTEQRVLQTLRDLHQGGHDLRYSPMKTSSQPLFFAAKELFGSYVNAVREAGIDYWQMSQAQLAKERAAAAAAGHDGERTGTP